MFGLQTAGATGIAVLGAHCDDIAIGMGATLFGLSTANPGLRVHALVLTGGGTDREAEEHKALSALTPGADLTVTVAGHPDGRTPDQWLDVKSTVREFARGVDADLVFGPQRADAHQDHRLLAEIIPTEFRDHLTLGYEIVKWENDLPTPTAYVPAAPAAVDAKLDALFEHYPSQHDHDWFDREAFLGLLRIRGIQSKSRYAEAFVSSAVTIDL
ncbi:PIG-L deacetylase family protein [Gordonia soli]|uniref:GlcNAc-PI de-N-acetylase n=1 Tax=Gordonia soli NBRC 108243 TaxID=1223545 RepID=M0QP16_9ACTN|nr:PIG-L family deacetylase [Gordonia soli]GAC69187.1 hypothetical protein GS4_22_00190 [Gordonia soli NBRC 108243]